MRRISPLGGVAGAAWAALQTLRLFHETVEIPEETGLVGVGVGCLAVLAAVRTVVLAWRGPVLVSLPREGAAMCEPTEAGAIRAHAQVRGTLGGGGHVHRARLAFPALAWVAAAAGAFLADPSPADTLIWGGILVASAAAAMRFPPKPFYYREAAGGRLVVFPAVVREEIARQVGREAARAPAGGA